MAVSSLFSEILEAAGIPGPASSPVYPGVTNFPAPTLPASSPVYTGVTDYPSSTGPASSPAYNGQAPIILVQVLTFGQILDGQVSKVVTTNLVFGQQLNIELQKSLGNTITFNGLAFANTWFLFPENTITFAQQVNNEYNEALASNITFQSLAADAAIQESVGNSLTFGQVLLGGKIFTRAISQNLTFLDLAFVKNFNIPASNVLTFNQSVLPGSVLNVIAQNQILFASGVKKVIEDSASNLITFGSEVARAEDPDNTILFGQVLVGVVSSTSNNLITFGQLLQRDITISPLSNNTLTFQSLVVGYVPVNCNLYEYTPHRGPTSLLPATIALASAGNITLDCAGSPQLVLRNPDFSNISGVDPDRVVARSRSGTLGIFRDPQWPKSVNLSFTVSVMKVAKRDEVETFLKFCLGKLVTLVDQETRTWTGIIMNPTTALTEPAEDQYAVTFEMSANAV